jgi:hypothetical protein
MIAQPKSTETPADDVVLVVKNIHGSEPPPRLEDGPDAKVFTAYFRSDMANQLVLQYDPKTRRGILRGGDTGWDRKFEIRDDELCTAGALFGDGELTLVATTFEVWTRRKLRLPPYYKIGEQIRAL